MHNYFTCIRQLVNIVHFLFVALASRMVDEKTENEKTGNEILNDLTCIHVITFYFFLKTVLQLAFHTLCNQFLKFVRFGWQNPCFQLLFCIKR